MTTTILSSTGAPLGNGPGPNRVLIRGGAVSNIRVSLPGIDVTKANLTQLAFDSGFANLQVYMRGVAFLDLSLHVLVISFGETLADPPIVCCTVDNITPWLNYQDGPGPATDSYGYCESYTNSLWFYYYAGSSGTIPIRYVAFRKLKG